MKTNNIKKRVIRVFSLVLTLSLMLSVSALSIFSQKEIIKSDETIIQDELVSVDAENDSSRYADDEVIILLADTPQVEAMQFSYTN